jgi:hypothetical protein
MGIVIEKLDAYRYRRRDDGSPEALPSEIIARPSWAQVQAAIRRMDNFCYPIVTIATDAEEQHALIIVGGPRRFAVADLTGTWQYERPEGGHQEVRLWASDQGYYCRERNIIRSRRSVLDLARAFFETGDLAKVVEVANALEKRPARPGTRPRRQRAGAAPTLFDEPRNPEGGRDD